MQFWRHFVKISDNSKKNILVLDLRKIKKSDTGFEGYFYLMFS